MTRPSIQRPTPQDDENDLRAVTRMFQRYHPSARSARWRTVAAPSSTRRRHMAFRLSLGGAVAALATTAVAVAAALALTHGARTVATTPRPVPSKAVSPPQATPPTRSSPPLPTPTSSARPGPTVCVGSALACGTHQSLVTVTGAQGSYPGTNLDGMAVGADGVAWEVSSTSNTLGWGQSASGSMTVVALPAGTSPSRIAVDGGGHPWITASGTNSIDEVDRTGRVVRSCPVPSPQAGFSAIGVAPTGMVWAAEYGLGNLVRVDPATCAAIEYSVKPSGAFDDNAFVFDRVGNLWFTDPCGNDMGELTVADGAVHSWKMPSAGAQTSSFGCPGAPISTYPDTIGMDASGILWVGEGLTHRVVLVDPGNPAAMRERATTAADISSFAVGPDGKMWAAIGGSNPSLARFTATGDAIDNAPLITVSGSTRPQGCFPPGPLLSAPGGFMLVGDSCSGGIIRITLG